MTVSNNDVWRISFRWTLEDGQDHVNVYHVKFNLTSDVDDSDAVDAVNDWLDDSYSDLNSAISNTTDQVDLKIDEVEFIGGEETITRNVGTYPFVATSFNPSGTGDTLPPGVALLAKFLTTIGKVYGRKFIGGIVETAQSGGVPSGGTIAQLVAYAAKILAGASVLAAGSFDPGVMSTRESAFVPFTTGEQNNRIAYQRRRRLGTGS